MRDVKYRALAKDGTWRYGHYPCLNVDMGNTTYPMDIFWNNFLSTLRRESLGQFTGLLDKNGKEIYEGDILKGADGENYPVIWHHQLAQFKALKSHGYIVAESWDRREIIGNIYTNPELLEQVK